MTANPYEGAVPLEHAGRSASVYFGLRQLAIVQKKFGKRTFLEGVAEILETRDADGIALLLSIGIAGETVESVLDWSPPAIPACVAIQTAFLLGMHGPTMEREKEAEGSATHPLLAHLTTSLRQLRQALMPASGGPNSGRSRPTQYD